MSVEGFDGELDNGGVDAASVENAWAVIGFNAGDEVVADEANLCSWDRQFEGQKHQVVFDQEVEFGVYFPEAGDDGLGTSSELILLILGKVSDSDVARSPHLDSDATDDAGDWQIT